MRARNIREGFRGKPAKPSQASGGERETGGRGRGSEAVEVGGAAGGGGASRGGLREAGAPWGTPAARCRSTSSGSSSAARSVLGFLPLLLGSSTRLGWAHSCGEGLIRCRGVCACSPSRLVALAGGLVGGCLLLEIYAPLFPPSSISCNACEWGVCLYVCEIVLMSTACTLQFVL